MEKENAGELGILRIKVFYSREGLWGEKSEVELGEEAVFM